MRQQIFITFINVLLLLLVSCRSTDTPAPIPPTEVVAVPLSPLSPIATPITTPELEIELSTPDEGFGTVGGILLTKNPRAEDSFMPVSTAPIFLAPLLYAQDGKGAFAGLDQDRDPATSTGPTGIFVFRNVPAGQYGLVVMHGVQLYLISDESGGDYVITVEVDKAVNLGEIHADLPSLD